MGLIRRPWVYKDLNDKKHKVWHGFDFRCIIENIEEPEEAEHFFDEYEKVAPEGLAEHNIAWYISLIADSDIRDDAADLFMINFKEHADKDGAITPEHLFGGKHRSSSLGILVDAEEYNEAKRSRKAIKKRKAA